MATQVRQDSSLHNSIGPMAVGNELLPVDITASGSLDLAPPIRTLDMRSTGQLPVIDDIKLPPPAEDPGPRRPGEIFLNGDVIMCACPDCRAPMSVRLWLMTAECWRCEAAIELSEDQEREAMRLLAEREAKAKAKPPAAPPAARPAPPPPPPPPPKAVAPPPVPPPPRPAAAAPPTLKPPPAPVRAPPPVAKVEPPPVAATTAMPPLPPADVPLAPPAAPPATRFKSPPSAAAVPAAPPRAEARRPAALRRRVTKPPVTAGSLLKMMPAWLISMLLHTLVIMLLAILTTKERKDDGPLITLSATIDPNAKFGGELGPIVKAELAKFDLPLPNKADLKDDQKREALLKANQDARELRLDGETAPLPDLERVKANIGNRDGTAFNFAARDPRLRVELVSAEGGTTQTEAAVARGLRWLSMHQDEEGSWSLAGFRQAGKCNCSGEGHFHGKAPGTALAMLPFLGAGQTHLVGRYKGNVARGVRWLVENQKPDGDLRAGANDNSGMYTQGQATIVLCEAFAMTGDEQLRIPAQKAIDFICKAQYRDGGWRYTPSPRDQQGDTSVVGWQLMALQSARAANLTVPDETLFAAAKFLNGVQSHGGSRYGYVAHQAPTPVMTAEALLCRMYLGWTKQQPQLLKGVDYLGDHLPTAGNPNIYFWYYGTQTMHHVGGDDWERWNLRMRDILTNSQESGGGHVAGSWTPRGEHAAPGGRIYMTSLAVCTLEVYYRHLPIFRQIELETPKK